MMRHFGCLLATAIPGLGCWSSQPEAPLPQLELLGVEPAIDVPLDGAVTLRFSGPITSDSAGWPVEARRSDGRTIEAQVELREDGHSLALFPEREWPPGERVSIELGVLFDELGRKVLEPLETPGFFTRNVSGPPVLTLRSPAPGTIAPLNLRSIIVSVVPAPDPAATKLVLHSEGATVAVPIIAASNEILIAELAPFRGACAPLCPAVRYDLSLDGGSKALGAPLAAITTSTVPDLDPPLVQLQEIRSPGGRITIHLRANEPIRARGTIWPPTGDPVALNAAPIAATELVLTADELIDPDLECVIGIAAEDLSRNNADPLVFNVVAPKVIEVRLSEIVTSPLHDWSDSEESGERFDGSPGGGAVTDADEWLELVNLSDAPIDLYGSALVLRVIDGTPSETRLASAPALRFSSGGNIHAWLPGEALVVHPRGAMAQDNLSIEVVWGDQLLDRIELSDAPSADHAGGRPIDLEHEALARDTNDRWRWCAPTPGDPSPAVACAQ